MSVTKTKYSFTEVASTGVELLNLWDVDVPLQVPANVRVLGRV